MLDLPYHSARESIVGWGGAASAWGARLGKSMVSTGSSRSGYPFTPKSMGMSPPLLLHWYRGGHRGGGGTLRIFLVVCGSVAGKPGRALVSPSPGPAPGSPPTAPRERVPP